MVKHQGPSSDDGGKGGDSSKKRARDEDEDWDEDTDQEEQEDEDIELDSDSELERDLKRAKPVFKSTKAKIAQKEKAKGEKKRKNIDWNYPGLKKTMMTSFASAGITSMDIKKIEKSAGMTTTLEKLNRAFPQFNFNASRVKTQFNDMVSLYNKFKKNIVKPSGGTETGKLEPNVWQDMIQTDAKIEVFCGTDNDIVQPPYYKELKNIIDPEIKPAKNGEYDAMNEALQQSKESKKRGKSKDDQSDSVSESLDQIERMVSGGNGFQELQDELAKIGVIFTAKAKVKTLAAMGAYGKDKAGEIAATIKMARDAGLATGDTVVELINSGFQKEFLTWNEEEKHIDFANPN